MNKIVIELSAEDRVRIDRLTAALENSSPRCDKGVQTLADVMKDVPPLTAPENAQDVAEAQTPEPVKPEPENATDAKPEPPVTPQSVEPTVTLEQIQQKVVQLAAVSVAKKTKVKEIINLYGAKVSDLKDKPEKWDEVWQKLTALESED